MLKGRLGLDTARIPYADRHGLLWLARGALTVESGTLRFSGGMAPEMEPGDYAIPFQAVSMILIGPGTTVSHDALRLMARHGACRWRSRRSPFSAASPASGWSAWCAGWPRRRCGATM